MQDTASFLWKQDEILVLFVCIMVGNEVESHPVGTMEQRKEDGIGGNLFGII